MKLEFGVGDSPLRDKKAFGVDIRKTKFVTYVCPAWEITEHVEPNIVTSVYSRHFMEHLTWVQVTWTMNAWHEILTEGGVLEIIVPDMDWHVKQWMNPNRKTKESNGITDQRRAIAGFWGHQREGATETWDLHKSGWDFELLNDMLQTHDFKNITRVKDQPKHLHVTCIK